MTKFADEGRLLLFIVLSDYLFVCSFTGQNAP